jgi:hypothetical protein
MMTTGHPTPSSAAAHEDAPARRPLELLEARRQRDTLKSLLRAEQAAMADFLVALAAFDAGRGWEPLGHASLFAFLHAELQLSRSATFWRLSAARLLQRFPEVVSPLRDGRLCLTTTAELAKVLTEQNMADVLPRYFHLSSREAAEVTAALQPREQPPVRTVVSLLDPVQRPAPTDRVPAELVGAPVLLPPPAELSGGERTLGAVLAPEPTWTHPARGVTPRDDVEPLSADLRRLHITVSRHLLKKLEAAQAGLGHALPGATLEQVIDAAVDLLLGKQARARAMVKRPRAVLPTVSSTSTLTPTATPAPTEPPPLRRAGIREAIPAAVRRAVWERDRGRCAWPLDAGGCCGSTHRLELDHIVPWARGGESTVANLRVVCARHNAVAARQAFGARTAGRYARSAASG